VTAVIGLTFSTQGQPRQAPAWAAGLSAEATAQERFDQDGNGWLDAAERKLARQTLAEEAAARPPSGLPTPRPGGEPTGPGPRIATTDVLPYPDTPPFDLATVRTFFLEFEDEDWEQALTEFRFTDVDVPAKLKTGSVPVFGSLGEPTRF
jgi:hypothetical protein